MWGAKRAFTSKPTAYKMPSQFHADFIRVDADLLRMEKAGDDLIFGNPAKLRGAIVSVNCTKSKNSSPKRSEAK